MSIKDAVASSPAQKFYLDVSVVSVSAEEIHQATGGDADDLISG